VILVSEVEDWYLELAAADPESAAQVTAAIDLLADSGPTLGRPVVDKIKGSTRHNLKELRPGSAGGTEGRVCCFIFDPRRQAILLAAGDKSGVWKDWYRENIPVAEQRYQKWLGGGYDNEEV
jgi:hypothetical protein